MSRDNPANRLCAVFENLRGLPQDLPMRQAWGKVLVGAAPRTIYSAYASVLSLVGQVVELVVNESPDLEHVAHQWEAGTLSALNECNVTDSKKVLHFISSTNQHMPFLKIAAALIGKGTTEHHVELDAIKELVDSFTSLLGDIESSGDISNQVKTYLKVSVGRIIGTLNSYEITGASAVLDALKQLAGGILLDRAVHSEVEKSSFSDSLTTLVTHAAAIVGITSVAQQILLNAPATVEAVQKISGL